MPKLTLARARRESKTARTKRTGEILARLRAEYPDARCALLFENPLELLVATVLAAQCTDARVNQVTRELFVRCPTAEQYATIEQEELEELIRSTGFYRNKAKSLRGLGTALLEDHDGEVPRTMKELVRLPGVGRKTANVVLGNAYGDNVGVVVDTHVKRLSGLLKLTEETDPVKVEADLMQHVPQSEWTLWSHLLIDHGRAICKARKPNCDQCVLADLCPSAAV